MVELTKKNMSIATYLSETREELKHVNWPSKKQSITFTVVVVAVSLVVAFFLGFFDYLFSKILGFFIS